MVDVAGGSGEVIMPWGFTLQFNQHHEERIVT